jgi:steroid 5-alpha reductase family enzyme
MELPSPIVMVVLFLTGSAEKSVVHFLFIILWEIHYINRTFIFPFRIRGDRKQMTLTVLLMAILFNIINGYLNGIYIFTLTNRYALLWLADPRFIIGVIVFFTGYVFNQVSDSILRNLRSRAGNGEEPGSRYRIPRGFLFERISCPNYFGEMVEWLGWAILTWSPSGFAFFIWTAANLIPRAISHHRWYLQEFSSYPQKRSAVIPYVL